jgi:hypothetical protein
MNQKSRHIKDTSLMLAIRLILIEYGERDEYFTCLKYLNGVPYDVSKPSIF